MELDWAAAKSDEDEDEDAPNVVMRKETAIVLQNVIAILNGLVLVFGDILILYCAVIPTGCNEPLLFKCHMCQLEMLLDQ
mmetsp:Transcript_5442/g.11824  ORF Transcript_5442/g.11824 Transcript_5442/m.11824 type:complete len:80 (+) Transcript_5442:3426-3665(+)